MRLWLQSSRVEDTEVLIEDQKGDDRELAGLQGQLGGRVNQHVERVFVSGMSAVPCCCKCVELDEANDIGAPTCRHDIRVAT